MTNPSPTILKDLGDGLILRRSTPADADLLAEFNSIIHSDDGPDKPEEKLAVWTRDLLTRPHPTFKPDDFLIVEETATQRIVSSINHISQTWSYEGIPFKVGRPELVGTLPEFRNKRLIAEQFAVAHQWSQERGELVQGITGIPYYYRQFGYEMALELSGGRVGFVPLVPELKEGQSEPYTMRPASPADIPFLMEVEAFAAQRYLIRVHRDEAIWQYELSGRSKGSMTHNEFRIIQDTAGQPVGFLCHHWFNWGFGTALFEYELKPGVSWSDVTPSVARYMLTVNRQNAERDGEKVENKSGVAFWHGSSHPVYEVWRDRLPRIRQPYAWYIRVPDLPAFIRHIAPALEARLINSYIPNYSGELLIGFYRSGLKLVFEKGKLIEASPFKPQPEKMGQVSFPDLTFLQLLFGFKSFDELNDNFVDVSYDRDESRVLISTLFPKKPSTNGGLS